jgi:hypothetical protein
MEASLRLHVANAIIVDDKILNLKTIMANLVKDLIE